MHIVASAPLTVRADDRSAQSPGERTIEQGCTKHDKDEQFV